MDNTRRGESAWGKRLSRFLRSLPGPTRRVAEAQKPPEGVNQQVTRRIGTSEDACEITLFKVRKKEKGEGR